MCVEAYLVGTGECLFSEGTCIINSAVTIHLWNVPEALAACEERLTTFLTVVVLPPQTEQRCSVDSLVF